MPSLSGRARPCPRPPPLPLARGAPGASPRLSHLTNAKQRRHRGPRPLRLILSPWQSRRRRQCPRLPRPDRRACHVTSGNESDAANPLTNNTSHFDVDFSNKWLVFPFARLRAAPSRLSLSSCSQPPVRGPRAQAGGPVTTASRAGCSFGAHPAHVAGSSPGSSATPPALGSEEVTLEFFFP